MDPELISSDREKVNQNQEKEMREPTVAKINTKEPIKPNVDMYICRKTFFGRLMIYTSKWQNNFLEHWSISRKLTDRHVASLSTNLLQIDEEISSEVHFLAQQPKYVDERIITMFSKEGDPILDVGSATGKYIL
jgi:DNA modification methylase